MSLNHPYSPKNKGAWRCMRRTGITSTDISAIVGENKYKSSLEVYSDKVDGCKEKESSIAMQAGNTMEDLIFKTWIRKKERGYWQVNLKDDIWYRDEDIRIMSTPDYIIEYTDKPGSRQLVEIKFSTGRNYADWGASGSDDIATHIIIQCLIQMYTTGIRDCLVVAYLGGEDIREYPVKYSDDYVSYLLTSANNFWNNHILKMAPPEPNDDPNQRKIIQSLYPANDSEMEIDNDMAELMDRYLSIKEHADEHNSALEKCKNEIALHMKSNTRASCQSWSISYKNQSRKKYSVPQDVKDKYRIDDNIIRPLLINERKVK